MKVPMFDLRVLDQELKSDLIKAMEDVLSHGILFMGPEVEELEKKIAEYIGVKYAIGVSSGSSALYLALQSCDIGPGDEVITTPLTWIITANAIAACGATPIFADISNNFNIDPNSIRERITTKTKAIIPMHYAGHMCDMEQIVNISEENNLHLIEDAAQSFGAELNGRKSGSFSSVAAFSMNPMKPFNGYGDAGFAVTNDEEKFERIKMLRYAGTRSIPGTNVTADAIEVSLNHKIDNINAALLLVSLKYFPKKQKYINDIAERYNKELTHHIEFQQLAETEIHGRYVYPI
ncbi:MAG: DegT/DnrJ/EryC1/StrS family aminotransferase, partial [Gammaproteobacteria bacterium]|nr:DegT/DnrJ/EryC1/StrS family aminotransferase [Gammaproteobacteria bacterium]